MQLLPSFLYKNKSDYSIVGYVDDWNGQSIHGWAVNKGRDSMSTQVKVTLNNELVGQFAADQPRKDVTIKMGKNKLYCGFTIPLNIEKAQNHIVRIFEIDSGDELKNSPYIISVEGNEF